VEGSILPAVRKQANHPSAKKHEFPVSLNDHLAYLTILAPRSGKFLLASAITGESDESQNGQEPKGNPPRSNPAAPVLAPLACRNSRRDVHGDPAEYQDAGEKDNDYATKTGVRKGLNCNQHDGLDRDRREK
jgi:hypothetical protein